MISPNRDNNAYLNARGNHLFYIIYTERQISDTETTVNVQNGTILVFFQFGRFLMPETFSRPIGDTLPVEFYIDENIMIMDLLSQ